MKAYLVLKQLLPNRPLLELIEYLRDIDEAIEPLIADERPKYINKSPGFIKFRNLKKNVNYFPVRLKNNAPKITHFNYLVLLDSDHMICMDKIKNGIWKNLCYP